MVDPSPFLRWVIVGSHFTIIFISQAERKRKTKSVPKTDTLANK